MPAASSECYPQLDFLESDLVKGLLENDFSLDTVDSVPFDPILGANTNLTNTVSSDNLLSGNLNLVQPLNGII